MSKEYVKQAVVRHEKGLHARAAAMVIQKAQELSEGCKTALYLVYKGRKIALNSLLLLVSLRIRLGEEISVVGQGGDAGKAVELMTEFLESDFYMNDAESLNQLDAVFQDNAVTAEQIFASMANGLIVVDEHDKVTVFNPAAEAIMNLKAAEVIGRPCYEVIPGSRLHIVRRTMVPELSCRQMIGGSVVITNRTPIVIDGCCKGAVAIFEDISAIEKMSWELREIKELKKRLELVLESAHDGICVVDKHGFITYVNPSYVDIVGQKAEEIIGKNVAQISPDGARNTALQQGRAVLGSISRKPSGATVIGNANPIKVDGEIRGVVSIIKKVSEVHELAHKLQQVEAKAEYLEHELRRTQNPGSPFSKFIGLSGKIRDALATAAKAAEGASTVLIRGESGTGKELVAEGIHYAGARAGGPFIRVNCAAIPANLLESELFGHEKGAFTGAVKRRLGKFELADKGTIFLDEIGEMEKSMQAKLLRVLQCREFERVGGEHTVKVDVRIIAATNRNLEQMVAEGEFREDLYYRLNVIPIFLPPLRERVEDIPLLVEHFLAKLSASLGKSIKGIKRAALDKLSAYHWPGNVRELENILERIIALTDGRYIEEDDLPLYIREKGLEPEKKHFIDRILPWSEYEKNIITMALSKYGSFNAAGKALGLTHKTVAAKARKYGIDRIVLWKNRT